ncbi:MAG: hypothetical protein C3F07_19130 [Anaerolineales bacterium]|nr:hypothetical protein [Anaerolineae bacterium]PWB69637.1 MAG: hypothetical protein C3F07_19130 [Anaerolineales bacterium]
MKYLLAILLLLLSGCAPAVQSGLEPTPSLEVAPPVLTDVPPVQPEATPATQGITNVDILANLPPVSCEAGLTPADQEGPYFKPNSPETLNLFGEGMPGERLILAGTVVNQDCLPIPRVRLDFWQADANGNYDNEGYALRGHQYTDNKGRYYLETVYPGIYSTRPIRHIHVKVYSLSGEVLVTQLYFPDQPVDGLTIQLEERGDLHLGYFNFVIQD